jgi:hypothetical protein
VKGEKTDEKVFPEKKGPKAGKTECRVNGELG